MSANYGETATHRRPILTQEKPWLLTCYAQEGGAGVQSQLSLVSDGAVIVFVVPLVQ